MSTYTVGSVIDVCRKRILDESSIDFDDPEMLNLDIKNATRKQTDSVSYATCWLRAY